MSRRPRRDSQSYGGRRDSDTFGHRLSGFVAYTISRSERSTDDGAGWRLLDFDQTHVATAALGYTRARWRVAARARYATGMPRTPVIGSYPDLQSGLSEPIFGAQNSTRLPAFFALDLRLERSVALGRAILTGYLELENVTDRANAEELAYNHDYSATQLIRGLPTLALAGLRLEL